MSEKVIKSFLRHKESLDKADERDEFQYLAEFGRLGVEFEKLRGDHLYSTNDGEKTCNSPKNRYKDILPFDYNRVILKDSDGDYINASYIKGVEGQKFIAAQGPLPTTAKDFWSMIWDHGVRVIIMACREYEEPSKKQKCFRYWSESNEEELMFGNITVRRLSESKLSKEVVMRKLLIKKNGDLLTILQLQYVSWPDKFIPMCVDSILSMLEFVRNYHPEDRKEPLVIHCSAGCGRTGSLVVIDYIWSLLKKGKISEGFNLFDIVLQMRKQRMMMVQNSQQYKFVYATVARLFQKKQVKNNPNSTITPATSAGLSNGKPNSQDPASPMVGVKHLERELNTKTPAKPLPNRSEQFLFKEYDLSFPNRVPKPCGPRSMAGRQ